MMKMKKYSSLVVTLLVLSTLGVMVSHGPLAIEAEAAVRYVGGTGFGNHSTIRGAILISNPGDIIHVYPGTYWEVLDVNKRLTIRGSSAEDTVIRHPHVGGDTGIVYTDVVRISANQVYFSDFTLRGGLSGIRLASVNSCTVEDNVIMNNIGDGMLLSSSDSNTIRRNNITSSGDHGIEVYYSDNNVFSDNMISSSDGHSIYLHYSVNNTFTGTNMSDEGIFLHGIDYEYWDSHEIDETNTLNEKPVYYRKNQIGGTIPPGAGQIILARSTGVTVEGQNCSHGSVGIQLGFSSNNVIINSKFASNKMYGIYMHSSHNNNIYGNNITDNHQGAYLYFSDFNTIANEIASNNYGVYLYDSWYTTIENSEIKDNNYGIYLSRSQYITLENNNITGNSFMGVYSYYSSHTDIQVNNISDNNMYGVLLSYSHNNSIVDSDFHNNSYSIYLSYSNDAIIQNNNVSKGNNNGIYMGSSHRNTVQNNTLWNNSNGVYIVDSNNGNIMDNNILSNSGLGVYLLRSHENTVEENTILDNNIGVYMWQSTGNHIIGNNISQNAYGIYTVALTINNTIAKNDITENTEYGLFVYSPLVDSGLDPPISPSDPLYVPVNNTIYHNNFINNTVQAFDNGENIWYLQYPEGGNHWSNWVTPDNYSGPNQNEYGSDGIVDNPYIIPDNYAIADRNVDVYPWVDRNGWVNFTPPEILASTMEPIQPYWQSAETMVLNADVNKENVLFMEMWYRYSGDDTTWENWTLFDNKTEEPWTWEFDFIEEGYYQFYTRAATAEEDEGEPSSPKAVCGYDATPPTVDAGSDEVRGEPFDSTSGRFGNASAEDALSGIYNISWSGPADIYFSSPFSLETEIWAAADGEYNITLTATDRAGNTAEDYFILEWDADPPVVKETYPLANEEGVFINASIVVTFSKTMDTESIQYNCTPDPGGWVLEWSDFSRVLTLTHNGFEYNTTYTFEVSGQDAGGKNLTAGSTPNPWNFTTEDVPAIDGPVYNVDTERYYHTIQNAIDESATLDGHTITVDAGLYNESVMVHKSLHIIGAGRYNTTIDGGGDGTVVWVTADHVTLTGFHIMNSGMGEEDAGVLVQGVDFYTVYNVSINNSFSGLAIWGSHRGVVENFTIIGNEHGIRIEGVDNIISNGIVTESNKTGIYVRNSHNTTISENTVSLCQEYGIYLNESWGNMIYHNNFLGNTVQAYDDGDNTWNLPYPEGGNHWSDWTSPDEYSGPGQNETGPDGIVDDIYVIPGDGNIDDYPWTTPYGWRLPPTAVYNVDLDTYHWSIQNAVDLAEEGNTLLASSRVYKENVVINKSLVLIGEHAESTVIDGRGMGDVVVVTTAGVTISGFTITGSGDNWGDSGIKLDHVGGCVFEDNIVTGNGVGIRFQNSNGSTIRNNTLSLNHQAGLYFVGSENNEILENNINQNTIGVVFLDESQNNALENNIITMNTEQGIRIHNSNLNRVIYNTISLNDQGILLTDSNQNDVYHNNFLSNTNHAEDHGNTTWNLDYPYGGNHWDNWTSPDNSKGPDQDILGSDGIVDNLYIIQTGVVDEYPWTTPGGWENHIMPVYNLDLGTEHWSIQVAVDMAEEENTLLASSGDYIENVIVNKSLTILGEDAENTIIYGVGEAVTITANNVTFAGFTITDGSTGILLQGAEGCYIEENILYNNTQGIVLDQVARNTVYNNTIYNSDIGVLINGGEYNTVQNNTIYSSEAAVLLDGTEHNILQNNTAWGNTFGVYIFEADWNLMSNNTFHSNYYGTMVESSFNNRIYHNNFLGNTVQTYDDGDNTWNIAYPEGGNHWSDWTSPDNYSGPNQDEPREDGIIDLPYNITGGSNQDMYPWYEEDAWLYGTLPLRSAIEDLPIYWYNSPLVLEATATGGDITYVEFWYQQSQDNVTWTLPKMFYNDTTGGDVWNAEFVFPEGDGYYRFYTRAGTAHEYEATSIQHTYSGFDATLPVVDAGSDELRNTEFNSLIGRNETAKAIDVLSGIANIAWTGPSAIVFSSPTTLDTNISATEDGTYIITLTVTDRAGNTEEDTFQLTWDISLPTIIKTTPAHSAGAVLLNAQIVVEFSKQMSITSVLYTCTPDPGGWDAVWSGGDTVMTLTHNGFDYGTEYTFEITTAEDPVGNALIAGTAFNPWTFTTVAAPTATATGPTSTLSNIRTRNILYTWTGVVDKVHMWYSTDEGGTWSLAGTDTTVNGEFLWTIPEDGRYHWYASTNTTYSPDPVAGSAPEAGPYVFDGTPPVVDAGSDEWKNSPFDSVTDRTRKAEATDESGIWGYQWSGPSEITFSSPGTLETQIEATADGTYTIILRAADNAGNTASDSFILVWDTSEPIVDAGSDELKNSVFHSLEDRTSPAAAVDELSGIETITWSGSGVFFGSANSLATTIWATTDGVYNVTLTVTDRAGNTANDTFQLTWDTTPPNVNAGSDEYRKYTFHTVYGRETTASSSDSNGIESHVWSSSSENIEFSSSDTLATDIFATEDGVYTITLTVTDKAGNVAEDNFTLYWDSVGPVVFAGSDEYRNYWFNTTSGREEASNMTPTTAPVKNVTWTSSSEITFSSPNTLKTNISAAEDGIYTIVLTVTDMVGNAVTDTFKLYWDTVAPSVNAGSDELRKAPFSTTAGRPTRAMAEDALSGIANITWTGPDSIVFSSPNTLPTNILATSDGTYTITLTVTDRAGNTANDTFQLTWDTTVPRVNAGSNERRNQTFSTTHNRTTTASASDTLSGIQTITWTGPNAIVFSSPNTLDTTISATTDGTYTITLTVTDNAGNTATDTFQLTWDTTPPNINAGSDEYRRLIFTSTTSRIINAHADDSLSGVGIVSWSGPSEVVFTSPDTLETNIRATSNGVYTITLTVTDNAGNTANDTFQLTWDTTPPNINAGSGELRNQTFSTTHNRTTTASASDTLSGIQTITWTGPNAIVFSSPNTLDTTISATTDGTYTITLTVTDNAGNTATDTFQLTWDTTPPNINAGSNELRKELFSTVTGRATNARASDSTSGIYSIEWTGPSAIVFSSPDTLDTTISATTDGTYTITLTVTDNAGNTATDTFQLTWDTTPPNAVARIQQDETNITIGDTIILDAGDSSDKSRITSYTWTFNDGRADITLEGETVMYRFTTSGAYTITLTVTDEAGNTGQDTIIVDVGEIETTPPAQETNLALIILVLLIIAIGVLLMVKKTGGKGKEESS